MHEINHHRRGSCAWSLILRGPHLEIFNTLYFVFTVSNWSSTDIKKCVRGLPWWLSGKPCQCRRCRFDPWSRKAPHATEQQSLCATATKAYAPQGLWAPTTEPVHPRAHEPQWLSLCTPGPVNPNYWVCAPQGLWTPTTEHVHPRAREPQLLSPSAQFWVLCRFGPGPGFITC